MNEFVGLSSPLSLVLIAIELLAFVAMIASALYAQVRLHDKAAKEQLRNMWVLTAFIAAIAASFVLCYALAPADSWAAAGTVVSVSFSIFFGVIAFVFQGLIILGVVVTLREHRAPS